MMTLLPFHVQELGLPGLKLTRPSSPRAGGGKAQCRTGVPCGDYCIPKGRKCRKNDPATGINPAWGQGQHRQAVAKAKRQRAAITRGIDAGMKREYLAKQGATAQNAAMQSEYLSRRAKNASKRRQKRTQGY